MKHLARMAAALVLGVAGTAGATSIDFDFESDGFKTAYPDDHYYGAINYSVGGHRVTVQAFEVINDNNGNIHRLNGTAQAVYSNDGLGAKSYASDSDSRVDGSSSTSGEQYIHDDGLLFAFAEEVSLDFLDFGSFGDDDDFNLTVDGVRTLVDFDEDETSALLDLNRPASDTQDDHYYFSGLRGTRFLVWADGSSDEFLVDELAVTYADQPGGAAPVPEPGTLLLLGTGLLGLAGAGRRAKRGS